MSRSRLVLGLLFVGVGGLRLAELAGVGVAWHTIGSWWPLVLIVVGLAQVATAPRNVAGGMLLALLGGGLLAFTLGVVSSLAVLWPLLLVSLGLWLLLGRRPTAPPGSRGPTADVVAVFDDVDQRAPAGPFTGGSITTVFGDVDLDLSSATLPVDGATLQVTTVFGDVDVLVPHDWEVEVSGARIFGSVRVPDAPVTGRGAPDGPGVSGGPETSGGPGAPRVLRVTGVTIFGDLDVRAVRVVYGAAR